MTDPSTPEPPGEPRPEAAGDQLPEDLNLNTALVGPYTFPDNARRRIAGVIYGVLALGCAAAGWGWKSGGLQTAAVVLLVVAAYQRVCAWPLKVDQTEALGLASNAVGFPIGHASAQLAWRGLRSKPTWRILCYSADEPPSIRGLVELDAVDGHVLGQYTEENPEDWAQYDLSSTEGAEEPEDQTEEQ